jgi:hypothetical protein
MGQAARLAPSFMSVTSKARTSICKLFSLQPLVLDAKGGGGDTSRVRMLYAQTISRLE